MVPQNTTITSVAGAIVFTLATIMIVISVMCMVYFYINRTEAVIKKSSPVFCQLMLVGIIFMGMGLIVWSLQQTMFTCVFKAWVTVIGFGLIMGNLLAKTYRIFKIFSNIRVTTSAIRDRDLLLFSAGVILIEIALLIVYTFGAGIPEALVVVSSSNYLYSYITCGSNNQAFHTAIVIAIISFNGVLVVLTAIVAFLTRNVDSAFNESKYIGATVRLDESASERGKRHGMVLFLFSVVVLGILLYIVGYYHNSLVCNEPGHGRGGLEAIFNTIDCSAFGAFLYACGTLWIQDSDDCKGLLCSGEC